MWSYMEFGPVVQKEMSFEDISYIELWQPFVKQTQNICAILVEGIMRNNSLKLFWIWTSGSGGNTV